MANECLKENLFCTGEKRGCFSIKKFAEKYSLELVAGNFYQAEYDAYCEKLYKQLRG